MSNVNQGITCKHQVLTIRLESVLARRLRGGRTGPRGSIATVGAAAAAFLAVAAPAHAQSGTCPADWDQSGSVNSADFFAYTADFLGGNADITHDGRTDSQDFFWYVELFLNGCTPGGSSSGVPQAGALSVAVPSDNPCVPNVSAQFAAMKRHADTSGFYAGLFSGDTRCWSDCSCVSHYQGIVRGPGPGVPHLYVSKNNDPEILVVRMGSRDTDGERLRSNRLVPGVSTEFTRPDQRDGEVNTVRFDDLDCIGLAHAGSMQVIGSTLAVPIDCHGWFLDPCDTDLPVQGVLALLDLSNPEAPTRFYTQAFPYVLGGTAIAKLPNDGRYLLLVAGGPGASLSAFISNRTDLHAPGLFFAYAGQWSSPTFGIYEGNFSIVKQCDGQLFVIGTYNPGDCFSPFQVADLWKLNASFGNGGGAFWLDFKESILLSGTNPGAGVACDFQAAAGTYVSPSGELIIYGTVHQRGDPFTAFAEFRRTDTVHPTAEPWVQLYSEQSGWTSPFGSSMVFDLPDRRKDDFLNLGLVDGFGDVASSVRWWAPAGCCIELVSNSCFTGNTGTILRLDGTGRVNWLDSLASTSIGDNAVSAIRFCFDAVQPFTCELPAACPSAACRPLGPDLVVVGVSTDSCVNRGQSLSGTVTIQNIGGEPAVGVIDLGMSLSIDNNPSGGGDDIPMGILDINIAPALHPGQTRQLRFTTSPVPNNATSTLQRLFAWADAGPPPCASLCESCEGNNWGSTGVRIAVADVGVTDLDYPTPVSSGQLVPITVSIRNMGCNRVCNTVTACIGLGAGSSCATEPFCVEPFDTTQVTVRVLAPPSELDCGTVDNFSLSACFNFVDGNQQNNCGAGIIGVIDEYWDLRPEVILPSQGNFCTCPSTPRVYYVRIWNDGTGPYIPGGLGGTAVFQTALCLDSGCNNYDRPAQPGDIQVRTVNSIIQPGSFRQFAIQYEVCGASCRTQYLKARINTGDACRPNNNCHQIPATVRCMPCN